MNFPGTLEDKHADVRFYYTDPNITRFHYAWFASNAGVAAVEFHSDNYPMVTLHYYPTVQEYLRSINEMSDMCLYDDVITELYNLLDNYGDKCDPDLQWLVEKRC